MSLSVTLIKTKCDHWFSLSFWSIKLKKETYDIECKELDGNIIYKLITFSWMIRKSSIHRINFIFKEQYWKLLYPKVCISIR